MLIGCCHCDEPSESTPPSEPSVSEPSVSEPSESSVPPSESSQSQSESELIPPGDCAACDLTGGYRPTTLMLTWDLIEYEADRYFDIWPNTGNCYSDYTGPFIVYSNRGIGYNMINTGDGVVLPSGAIECFFGSIEQPLLSIDCSLIGTSTDPTNCRAYAWFVKSGSNYAIYALIYWRNHNYAFTDGLCGGGIWYNSETLVTLNCFGTYNLSRMRMHEQVPPVIGMLFAPGPGFNYEYSDDSPTLTNSFPETLVVTAL